MVLKRRRAADEAWWGRRRSSGVIGATGAARLSARRDCGRAMPAAIWQQTGAPVGDAGRCQPPRNTSSLSESESDMFIYMVSPRRRATEFLPCLDRFGRCGGFAFSAYVGLKEEGAAHESKSGW